MRQSGGKGRDRIIDRGVQLTNGPLMSHKQLEREMQQKEMQRKRRGEERRK